MLSGGLIVFAISRLFRKKEKAIPEIVTGYKPAPLLPSSTKNSFDEIYQLLRKEEGFDFTARRDGSDEKGNPKFTIGIGHQIQEGEEYLLTAKITEEEGIILFKKDIEAIVADMNKNIKVPLNKNQQLALIDLRYRIGPGYFNNSTLLKELNKGNFQKASEEFKNWRLSDGRVNNVLVQRAERERIRFVTPPSESGLYTPIAIPPISKSSGAPKFFPTNIPSSIPRTLPPIQKGIPFFFNNRNVGD